jgi:hypothetical protein
MPDAPHFVSIFKRSGLIQVHCRVLAATINLDIEFKTVTLVERGETGAFDGRNMHEGIRLAIITLDEAKALHGVEELHSARRTLAGQLTLRATFEATSTTRTRFTLLARFARCAFLDRHRFAVNLQVGRRNAAAAINQGEAQRLAISQTGQARLFNRADVHEHILATIITHDEAEALLAIEELHDTGAFADHLRGHAATGTAAATTAAKAATTAAEAAATSACAAARAATGTKAATAATIIVETTAIRKAAAEAAAITESTAAKRVETFATEIIAPITAPALTAPPSIKTHASQIFPGRPNHRLKENCVELAAFFPLT